MFSIQVSLIVLHYTSGYSLQHKTNCAFIFKHTVLGAVLQDRNNNLLLMDRQTQYIYLQRFNSFFFKKKQLNKSSLSFTFEGTTVQLPVSFQLPLARLTQPTSTIWWRGLNATNSHTQGKNEAFLLPRQPEPKPLKPAAVKLLGPPCLFAKTTLLQASVIPHRFLKLCVRRENESAQRRCLPLSDGERYRGCTAAQRRIT